MPTVFEKLSSQLDIIESAGIVNITDPANIRKPFEVFSATKTILRYNEDDFNYTLDCYNIQNPTLYHKAEIMYENLQKDYPLYFEPIPLSRWERLFKFKRRNKK